MDLADVKTGINARLHLEITGGRLADTPPDRLIDEAALAPVLAEMAKENWTVTEEAPGLWGILRPCILRETRGVAHQAAAEARGEVVKGDNTYEHTSAQHTSVILPFSHDDYPGVRIDDSVVAKAHICLAMNGLARSPKWVRDA